MNEGSQPRRIAVAAALALLGLAGGARAQSRCDASWNGDETYWDLQGDVQGVRVSIRRFCMGALDYRVQVCARFTNTTTHELELRYRGTADCGGTTYRAPRESIVPLKPGGVGGGGGYLLNSECFAPCERGVVPAEVGIEAHVTDRTREADEERRRDELARHEAEDEERERVELKTTRLAKEKQQQEQDERHEREQAAQRATDEHPDSEKREDDRPHGGSGAATAVPTRTPEEIRREQLQRRYEDEQRDADARRRSQDASLQTASAGLAGAMARGDATNGPTGSSWRVHVRLALGGMTVPVFDDVHTTDIPPYSMTASGSGAGSLGSLELWPVFGRLGGLGLFVEGAAGTTPTTGGTSIALQGEAGARIRLGPESGLSILAEGALGLREATDSFDAGGGVIDALASGSAAFQFKRLGAGLQLCVSADDNGFCGSAFSAIGIFDWPEHLRAGDKAPLGVRAEFWARGFFALWIEIIPRYPAAGNPEFAVPSDDTGRDVLGSLFVAWDLDYFGHPAATSGP